MPQPESLRIVTEEKLELFGGGLPARVTLLDGQGQRGYKVSQTAGRTVTVWDYLNNREQIIYGDTGWRKVDAALPAGVTASNVWLRRQGNEVTINVQNLRADTVGTVTVYNAPVGYRPDAPSVRSGVYASSSGTARIISPFAGNVRVLSMGAGESLDGSVTFTTPDPWPTSLPGVAA